MDTQKTGKFFIGSIIGFIIIFGLVSIILSSMQDIAKHVVKPASMATKDVAQRIKPVAQVNVGEPPVAEVVVVAAATTKTNTADDAGAKIVDQTCALCHRTGMMSAPKLGSADDWMPRLEQGMDALYDHAINGFNMMPPRGNNDSLTDDEVRAAVDYMIVFTK